MMRTDREYLDELNATLEDNTPQQILARVLEEFGPNIAISTAFGVEGCALIHMAVQIDPNVQVFTVDPGYLFAETQALKEQFVSKYGIKLRTFEPVLSKEEQEREHGPNLWERDSDVCCRIRKVEPTKRALDGLDAWVAGLRRDQSASRANIEIVERLEREDGKPLIKIHPLANWNRVNTWTYVLDQEVPYNPLLDQGYKSIGCQPCTRPVVAGGDERSGRWGGGKLECGIHTLVARPVPAKKVKRRGDKSRSGVAWADGGLLAENALAALVGAAMRWRVSEWP